MLPTLRESLWVKFAFHEHAWGCCIARFDHHCVWLDQAVGAGNHVAFLGFLVVHGPCGAHGERRLPSPPPPWLAAGGLLVTQEWKWGQQRRFGGEGRCLLGWGGAGGCCAGPHKLKFVLPGVWSGPSLKVFVRRVSGFIFIFFLPKD